MTTNLLSLAEMCEDCPDCGGYGEYFGHAPDCYSDSCALAGGIDDCSGQVFECHCAASLRARASAHGEG